MEAGSFKESLVCQARVKELGKERKVCLVEFKHWNKRRREKQMKEILGNLGREAELRQQGEHLQLKEAHETIVLHMGGGKGLPPPWGVGNSSGCFRSSIITGI